MSTPRLAHRAASSDKYDHMHEHGNEPSSLEGRVRPTQGDADLGLAILIAEAADGQYKPLGVVSTQREAIEESHADYASRITAVGHGEDALCPEQYVLWTRGASGAYERAMAINPGQQLPERQRSATAGQRRSQEWSLVLTSDGFLNLAQACELRLRYVDPTTSDAVWGVDVILANGASRLIEHKDPGFDQLIELIEDQGYTIATAKGDA